jgi:hypothetical protein
MSINGPGPCKPAVQALSTFDEHERMEEERRHIGEVPTGLAQELQELRREIRELRTALRQNASA